MALLPLRAAICHASPIFLSAQKTTQKTIDLIHEASRRSANLVVFPETFIPAFPVWSSLQAPYRNHDFFYRMSQESIYADGDEMHAIRNAAKQAGVLVNIGFSEKSRHSTATLYNSNLIIGTEGEVLVHHRKLMPTFFEKLTWSPGDGAGLRVAKTKYGNIGTLICGENTNPLARYAMMAQAEQVHISTWPGIWPTRVRETDEQGVEATPTTPTSTSFPSSPSSSSTSVSPSPTSSTTSAANTTPPNYDNVSANRIRGAAHCFEAKCFGILSASHLSTPYKTALASATSSRSTILSQLNATTQAPSMFLDPTGAILPGFTYDPATGEKQSREFLQNEDGILYADLDLRLCVEGKQYHDVTGGYQRLDVFKLEVDRRRWDPVSFRD